MSRLNDPSWLGGSFSLFGPKINCRINLVASGGSDLVWVGSWVCWNHDGLNKGHDDL